MLIAPAVKISKDFETYLKAALSDDGPVFVTSEDDKLIAVIDKISSRPPALGAVRPSLPNIDPQRGAIAAIESIQPSPSVEEVLRVPALIELFMLVKPHLEKYGRIITTATPDIRVEIEGRKKNKTFARILPRMNCLKLNVKTGDGTKEESYELFPRDGVPAELDSWLKNSRRKVELK